MERLISAQEEERSRIARELHDAASQSLAALALNLETVADDVPGRYKDVHRRLAMLKEHAVETIGGIRELAVELRPAVLDNLGLARAVNSYAKDFLEKRGIGVRVTVVNSGRKLPAHTETMLFRIAQEALTNIVKHAEATQVEVRLEVTDSLVVMQVEDNGKGFDSDSVLHSEDLKQSLGLYSISERAVLLGGTVAINSEIGRGTSIMVQIPLEAEENHNGHH